MTHLQVRRRLLLGAAGAMAAPWVHAQSSSDAPVRLVVPFTAGTGIDLLARQVAPGLSERLKRPFYIENKPGASGAIACTASALTAGARAPDTRGPARVGRFASRPPRSGHRGGRRWRP